MFDNINVNLHKNEGFLTSIPYSSIPEHGQSNAPLDDHMRLKEHFHCLVLQMVATQVSGQMLHYPVPES